MKKILCLFGWLVLMVWPTLVRAQLSENQRWIEQVDGGFIFPISTAAGTLYDWGFGGDILIGYRFDRNFSLSADVGYYDCDEKSLGGDSGEWLYSPILLLARYNFGSGSVRPYLILGAGLAVNSYSLTSSFLGQVSHRETNPLLSPGLGILFVVTRDTALYIQTRLDLNFSTANGPWIDNPSIFLPLKGGLSFFAF
jgi:hypothetical protein